MAGVVIHIYSSIVIASLSWFGASSWGQWWRTASPLYLSWPILSAPIVAAIGLRSFQRRDLPMLAAATIWILGTALIVVPLPSR